MVIQEIRDATEDKGLRDAAEDKGLKDASEEPAILTTDTMASSNDLAETETESNVSSNNNCAIMEEESPEVKKATDRIISNAASIDVIVPLAREASDVRINFSCGGLNGDKMKQHSKLTNEEEKETIKKDSFIRRFFRGRTEGLSGTQLAVLCIFPFVEFFAATIISIQGPFYPRVAREKGATPSEYGLVFGSFEIVVFLMAPIYGAKMGQFNPHRLFNYGIFTTGCMCILFGFVHHINDRVFFIVSSLIIRVIEAVGDAAFVTASFSIIAVEFPDSVATTFAMMETFYGLGMIAGPTVGGALFEAGGFTLPFAVMGGLLFIAAIATYTFITSVSKPDTEKIVASSSFEMFKMLKIPAIALTAYGAFAGATGIGFLSNNLEHHLEEFKLSEFQVGSIFMLNGGVYALSAPLWGRFCDKSSELKIFSLVGSLLIIVGFSVVGPLPFFDFNPSIFTICIGLVIFGLGIGSTLVSAFIQFLHDALANGHPENVSTHGLVSGLWTSMVALGFFAGPTIGGVLDDAVGFRWGSLFIVGEQLVLVVLLAYFFLKLRQTPTLPTTQEETSPPKDNLDDIVITDALKTDTPKSMPRKRGSGKSQEVAEDKEQATTSTTNSENDSTNNASGCVVNAGQVAVDSTNDGNVDNHKPISDITETMANPSAVVTTTDETEPPKVHEIKPKIASKLKEEDGLENPTFVDDQ